MNETQLLDETLKRLQGNHTLDAYNYLVSKLHILKQPSSQVYNFLYCLAATSHKKQEALDWLQESIETKGYWYRPEVFEDEDLDSIREDQRFKNYIELSYARYTKALGEAKTIYTWSKQSGPHLLTVLHGNQQNNTISNQYWSNLDLPTYQVEYLQSKEVDSYDLFRWEDKGTGLSQLEAALNTIPLSIYTSTALGGFSAGCNTILRGIAFNDVTCEKIILQSPWFPCIEDDLDVILSKLKEKNIETLVICGLEDEDCLPQCLKLESKAKALHLPIEFKYIEGLGHEYPTDFNEMISAFLKH